MLLSPDLQRGAITVCVKYRPIGLYLTQVLNKTTSKLVCKLCVRRSTGRNHIDCGLLLFDPRKGRVLLFAPGVQAQQLDGCKPICE